VAALGDSPTNRTQPQASDTEFEQAPDVDVHAMAADRVEATVWASVAQEGAVTSGNVASFVVPASCPGGGVVPISIAAASFAASGLLPASAAVTPSCQL